MDRRIVVHGVLIGLLILSCVVSEEVLAQRFPYEAPRAPEFDGNGNYRVPQRQEPVSTTRITAPYRVAPRAPDFRPPPSASPDRSTSSHEPATVASSPPPLAPPEPQGPPDCSQFPMMIATAQSREAMQWHARQYLTCLLNRGWRMEQARQEVIRVIETAHGKPQ